MKLHLGCGEKILDGFINVDSRKLNGVDIVDDIKSLESFGSETAELIYASHVLEHVGRREYIGVLKRWCEILKPGGKLRIAVPDFESVAEYYMDKKNIDHIMGFLYGGQTYPENYHYCAWDFRKIKEDLESVGFTKIHRYNWRNTEHSHIDDYSQCYLPHMDKDHGKLMSLNVEAIK